MSEEFLRLARYNAWANAGLVAAATGLAAESLMRPGVLTHGSAFETLLHVLDCEWSYRRACEGFAVNERVEAVAGLDDIEKVAAFWQEESRRLTGLVETLRPDDFTRTVHPSWWSRDASLGEILLHVTHHSAAHRGEIGWYLHREGSSPGDLDLSDYVDLILPSGGSQA